MVWMWFVSQRFVCRKLVPRVWCWDGGPLRGGACGTWAGGVLHPHVWINAGLTEWGDTEGGWVAVNQGHSTHLAPPLSISTLFGPSYYQKYEPNNLLSFQSIHLQVFCNRNTKWTNIKSCPTSPPIVCLADTSAQQLQIPHAVLWEAAGPALILRGWLPHVA
jgi:hypothetical protein